MSVRLIIVLYCYLQAVLPQKTGSGTDGNYISYEYSYAFCHVLRAVGCERSNMAVKCAVCVRLCIVEGRGTYKRAPQHCPILDKEKSGIECVLGTDRLDCLRRINKGTVDFGVFSPEDLVAAQWANTDVLVTNEVRLKNRPFARSIVAVVNKRILPDSSSNLHAVLRNSTLCHPGETMDDIRPLSETLSGYLETLILERSCDPKLSSTENKLKALADFYSKACKPGPWVPDKRLDAELKSQYPSLCEACVYRTCLATDPYWGGSGALTCLTDGVGDVTWGEADDIAMFFKPNHMNTGIGGQNFAYLCRDGTWRDMGQEPCVWLKRPWNVIVAKRKAAEAVSQLTESLRNSSVIVYQNWKGALAALLEINQPLPEPLHPPKTTDDYLATAEGFREAYSQTGCDPPRHINLCTTSVLARHKCEWLSEAGAVYGIVPPLQCALRESTEQCLDAVASGECDTVVADSDYLISASRLSLEPLLHEITPIVEKMNTVVAYVNTHSKISKMADLRGKRAAFPRYDSVAWHSVLRYVTEHEKISCNEYIDSYFEDICAPGLDGKKCYEAGEEEALKSLLDGKSDVAFVSMQTFNSFKDMNQEQRLDDIKKIIPLCPEGNQKYCFVSWSNLGHVFAAKNLTEMRKHEIINVFTKLDQLFGLHPPFRNPMFSLYGPFNHELEVIFHSNTRNLATGDVLKTHPYDKIPYSFELSVKNDTDYSCNFGAKRTPSLILLLIILVAFILR